MSPADYQHKLETLGILIKAKNFLVFQVAPIRFWTSSIVILWFIISWQHTHNMPPIFASHSLSCFLFPYLQYLVKIHPYFSSALCILFITRRDKCIELYLSADCIVMQTEVSCICVFLTTLCDILLSASLSREQWSQ